MVLVVHSSFYLPSKHISSSLHTSLENKQPEIRKKKDEYRNFSMYANMWSIPSLYSQKAKGHYSIHIVCIGLIDIQYHYKQWQSKKDVAMRTTDISR